MGNNFKFGREGVVVMPPSLALGKPSACLSHKWRDEIKSDFKRALLFLFFLIFSQNSFADVPVIDPTEIFKTVQETDVLKHSYDELKQQYDKLQDQYNAVIGSYGWNDISHTVEGLKNRAWGPSDWDSALKNLSGGNSARYQELLDDYKKNHLVMKAEDYLQGSDQGQAQTYQNQVQTNQVSTATATYEFNDLSNHLDQLKKLGAEIDSAQNKNIKSAMDLNTEVEVELGYISIEELRMQSLLNQQSADLSASKISAENEAAEFNNAGE